MKIVELRHTCEACPAQWEGRLEDGRYLYVRYRWGTLQVGLGPTFGDAVGNSHHDEVEIGGAFDGYLSYDELRERLPDFEWPKTDWTGGELFEM
jgi:hypothetical protein